MVLVDTALSLTGVVTGPLCSHTLCAKLAQESVSVMDQAWLIGTLRLLFYFRFSSLVIMLDHVNELVQRDRHSSHQGLANEA